VKLIQIHAVVSSSIFFYKTTIEHKKCQSCNALFTLRAFRFLHTALSKQNYNSKKLNTSKNNIFLSIPHPSVSRSFLSSSSILSPFRLRSIFLLAPFVPLSHFVASASHVLDRLTFLAAHPALSCSHVYLLDLPHQSFAYSSLSLSTLKYFLFVHLVEGRPVVRL
jgi:hypothetical protein